MMSLYTRRIWINRIGITLSMLAMSLGLIALLWILWTLFSRGFAALSWDLFTQDTPAPGSEGGGLRNAIVGSGLILLFSMLISTPVGILAGIYLAEFGRISKFASFTRFMTENMLKLVPTSLREAAFAVGAPRWQVSLKVTLRAVKSGVVTGVLLAMARITGETAPLLFTALNNQFLNTDMAEPMGNLPVVIYQFALSPYDNWVDLAWGGALLIAFLVLAVNIGVRVIFRNKDKR